MVYMDKNWRVDMLRKIFPVVLMGKRKSWLFHRRGWRILVPLLFVATTINILAPTNALGASPARPQTATSGGGFIWTIETVESLHNFYEMGPRSLGIDLGNRLHLAYGDYNLYYAYFNGTTWCKELVDSAPWTGQYTSVAIAEPIPPATTRKIHISYYDALNGRLKYAQKTEGAGCVGGWTISVLDTAMMASGSPNGLPPVNPLLSPPLTSIDTNAPLQLAPDDAESPLSPELIGDWGMGMYTGIALDSLNRPYISYYDGVNQQLRLATFNGLIWSIQTVWEIGHKNHEGKYTSITIDWSDLIHIAFLDDSHDDLRYAHFNGSGWNFFTVEDGDPGRNIGGYTSIVTESRNNAGIYYPIISYYDQGRGSLKVTGLRWKYNSNNIGGYWEVDSKVTVDDGPNGSGVGGYTSLVINPDRNKNSLCVSYYDFSNQNLKYACWEKHEGTWGWWKYVLKSDGRVGLYTSAVKMYESGTYKLHITYVDLYNGWLREIYKPTTAWLTRDIDETNDFGVATSLALDNLDRPHISYLNSTKNDLKYAYKSGGVWSRSVVTSTGTIGDFSSIDTDSSNFPHIAFYDKANTSLRYASWDGANWNFETVDNLKSGGANLDTGQYPSLAIQADVPYITYYNASWKDLRLAVKNPNWITSTLVGIADVGMYNSIAVNSLGDIYVSYYNEYEGEPMQDLDFKFWYAATTTWMATQNIDPSGHDVGRWSSVTYDGANQPMISYVRHYVDQQDRDWWQLRYITANWNVLSGWVFGTPENIETSSNPIEYTSIDVDTATNTPYICYYDAGGKDLRFAYKSAGSWFTQAVDSIGDVGKYCSLEVDSTGLPHIAYYDESNSEVKYAKDPIYAKAFMALPNSMTLLVDSDDIVTRTSSINVELPPPITWTAETPSNWLYLGPTGNSQLATGLTGENLIIRIDPFGLALGTYDATIEITGTEVITENIAIRLIRVVEVFDNKFPIIFR